MGIEAQADELRAEIARCQVCAEYLPNPPRPLCAFSGSARIVITGQAPGRLAHESGIPWDDPSGRRLREWLGVDDRVFYDDRKIALMPMGFCFPGTGTSGDLPPRKECQPQWHDRINALLPEDRLILLVGTYAHKAYLPREAGKTLEPRIRTSMAQGGNYPLALPHPSWRVAGWMKRNPWFEAEVLPWLRHRVKEALAAAER